MTIRRRDLLKGGAAVAGAFTLGFVLPGRLRAGPVAGTESAAAAEFATAFAPNAFIRITPDNRVTVVVGKSEMGQNVFTALPLIVAEELDADWAAVGVEQSGVDAAFNSPWFPMMLTGGSSSVHTSYETLRRVGATARAMLMAAAAAAWSVPAGRLVTRDGSVSDPVSHLADIAFILSTSCGMKKSKFLTRMRKTRLKSKPNQSHIDFPCASSERNSCLPSRKLTSPNQISEVEYSGSYGQIR